MVVNRERIFYRGLKKTGALLLALVLTLDIGGSFVYARAEGDAKTITYTPGSVQAVTGTNTSYEWRYINNMLDVTLPFSADNNAFNSNNSAVLALTSSPDTVPEVIVEEEEVTPEPQPQGGGVGGAPQTQQEEVSEEVASSTPEVIEEDNASTTPEVIEEEPEEDVTSSIPDVVEAEEEATSEEPTQAKEEAPVVENVVEEKTLVEAGPIPEPQPEPPTSPVETSEPETPTSTPEPEQVETSSLFGSLNTISLFASIGESLLPTRTLLADVVAEEEGDVVEETIPSLVVSNFTADSDDEDLRFKAADLYIWLAGDAVPGATLIIEYQTDNIWTTAETLSFDTAQSNKDNGDYFKTTLKDITTQADIENLSVRLTYELPRGASIPLSSQSGFLYIDGLHLETTSEGQILDPELTLFPEAELIETRTPEEQALARLEYANRIFELLKEGASSESFKILNKKYLEESPLELSLVGAATTSEAILMEDGDVVYRDIYPSTDFIYRPTETGLKEEILLKEPSHPGEFTYLLNLDDFDYLQTETNEIGVYQKGYEMNPLKKLYTISAPYMEDALGERSENLSFIINGNEVTLIPDYEFLGTAVYPVLIDPTVEIEVLTTYQHPLTGENWVVDFATVGESDLYITPRNQVTIDEIEFVSLVCDGEERIPDIQAGEVLYYPNWSCDGIGTVTHLINQEGGHILDFTFGGGEEEVQMDTAFNGTVTWDGGGVTNNWSECTNWSADACPLTGDDVVFDGTSTKDATLDTATTVRHISINAGYTGTITQAAGANLTHNNFTQAAGTFRGGAATTTGTNSTWSKTGGTFIAASTTEFTGSSFPVGGYYNITATGGITFEDVYCNRSSYGQGSGTNTNITVTGDMVVGSGCNIGSVSGSGGWYLRGDMTQNISSLGTMRLYFDNASLAQTYFIPAGGTAAEIVFDSSDDANDVLDLGGDNIKFYGITLKSSFGTTFSFTNPSNYTILIGAQDLNIETGTTFQGGAYTLEFADAEITKNGTFTAPSTTRFSGSAFKSGGHVIYSTTTPITFEDLEFTRTGTSQTFYLGTDVIATGDVTLSGAGGITGSGSLLEYLYVRGDVTQASSFTATGQDVNIVFDNASVAQTYTINGGTGPILVLDSSDDVDDTVTINANTGFRGFRVRAAYGDTFSFDNPSAYDITFYARDFAVETGAGFLGGAGTTTMYNADTFIGGTFTAASTTVFDFDTFQSGNYGFYASSSVIFKDKVIVSGNRGFDIKSTGVSLITEDDFQLIESTGILTSGSNSYFDFRGNTTLTSSNSGSTARLYFTGSSTSGLATQTLDLTGATGNMNGDIVIDKDEGEIQLLSALDMDASSQDLVLTDGTLNLNGQNLNVDGTSGTMTVSASSTLKLQGGETVTTNTGYPTFAADSTVEYVGDGDAAADSYTLQDWIYSNLTVNFTDSGDSLDGDITPSSSPDPLRSYWKFDDGTGTTATDEQAVTNGSLQNMEAGDWDSVNKATLSYTNDYSLAFDGVNEYVIIADATDPTAYTISFWVRPTDVTSTNIWVRTSGNPAAEWANQLRITSGSKFQHYVYDGGAKSVTGTTDVVSGTWYHVAITAENSGQMRLYVNGTEEGTATSIGTLWTGGNQYMIGSNSGDSMGYFAGNIDDVRFYTEVLSTDDISLLAAGSAPGSPGDVDITDFTLSGGTFTAPSTTMTVSGDWSRTGGTFTPNSGTVSLDGTSQTVSGSTTFYNLSKAVGVADTLTYTAGTRQTVTNAWTMTGTAGNILTLQSSSGGTQWEIDPQNLYTIEYVTVSDSNNVGSELSINESIVTNGGNNTNWGFNNLPTASSLGPSNYVDGSWGTDTTPTITFTTSDSDAENVKYHILIDDSSDFSSPVVNYTSALETQGSKSFTVGQVVGSGTYTTGSSGQTLSTGSYYWRASATDASGGSGATTTANSGAVAFRLDTTAPTAGTAATSSVTATTTTVTISGASDADSGLASSPYNFHDQTEDNYSGATSAISYQFTGLVPDTEYVFEVQVTDTAGNTATTSTVTQRTLAAAPTSPTAVANSETAITFSWSGGTNPPTVSYYPVNITSSTTPGFISAKTYQFTGLTCATEYSFEVKARNSDDLDTATTTAVSATTNACGSDSEGGGEEGGGGTSETGGGGGGEGGSSSPTITYTQTSQTPVDTALQTFTITSESFETSESTTVVSENRVIYLTFEPPQNTQYVIIANNPDFEGGEYFLYSPDFAVQWNVCKAADGTILPDSQCARNLEYNVYIKFVNYQGLESTVTKQNVFLYDPILPDSYFEFPEQNVTVNTLEQRRIVTLVEFPFDDPFTDATGIRTRNTFGEVVANVVPGAITSTTDTNVPAGFVDAATRYKEALRASYNITFNVVGSVTRYITRVVGNPYGYIRDNVTINTYLDGFVEGFGKVRESTTKVTLTRFEWLFGNAINTGTSGGGTETGGGAETGGGKPTSGGGGNPIVIRTNTTNETVRTVISGVAGGLEVTDEQVKSAATVAAVIAPGLLALQQALASALFAGAFAWADLIWLILRWLHDLATFFHMRNKRRTWGYVYDAKTKMPLEPVLVELIDTETGRVIDQSVTDQTGQFGFIPRVGHFRIEARKANYTFPSQKVAGSTDGAYTHVYHGESFTIADTNKVIAPNIPMDAVREDQGQLLKGLYLKLHLLEHNWGHRLTALIFWAGFLVVSANLMISLTALNIIIFGFYLVLVSYRYIKLGTRLWGHLENIPELPKDTQIILELTHRKSPSTLLGRALAQPDDKFFLKTIAPGTYVLSVKAIEGKKEHLLLKEDIAVGNDLVINHDIYLG